jgi:hypothetical protein
MRALSNLIALNQPDLVLFVGEALVGNDAVDQLVKFNRSLADLAPNAAMSESHLGFVTCCCTWRGGWCTSVYKALGYVGGNWACVIVLWTLNQTNSLEQQACHRC